MLVPGKKYSKNVNPAMWSMLKRIKQGRIWSVLSGVKPGRLKAIKNIGVDGISVVSLVDEISDDELEEIVKFLG